MGNDGGSIPKRRELVKEAAKDLSTTQTKETQNEQQEYYWTHCALSNQPLSPPVVSDALGRLYNKDAVLESLIANGSDNADNKGENSRIGSLRDVVEVNFCSEEMPDGRSERRSASSMWVCPTTNKTLGPGVKAIYLVPCGHAFSESAVKEISGDVCLECNESYSPENIITILPIAGKDKDRLNSRLLKLKEQGLTHSLKKVPGVGKKRKKTDTANGTISVEATAENRKSLNAVQTSETTASATNGIRNAGTASLTAKVLAEQNDRNKRRKTAENDNLKVAKFYKATDRFTCISNPSVTLSASQVNDDYCDCPDGSDEPGTSACSYLSDLSPTTPSDTSFSNANTTLALPGFYCKNKGHQPSYIPFYTVNDGVCDSTLCCDGSDEWAKVGGVSCDNKCKEIGKEWKKHDEQRQKSASAAAKKRKELVADAARRRKEVEDRMYSLGTEIDGSRMKVQNLEAALADVERQERAKVIKGPGKASKVNVLAGLAKDRIEELRNSLIEVREQRESAKASLLELETILSTFKEEYNPNFNDEGVKRAVRSWEEYAARDKSSVGDEAHDRDLNEISKPDSDSGAIRWEEWEKPEESDTDVLYSIEEYLPPAVRDWVDKKLRDLRVLLIENGVLAPSKTDPDAESKALTDARNALKAAQDDLSTNENELKGHREDLDKDYGHDDVFRALKGQCVSKDSGEYTYELCWLGETQQKPKKRGGNTGMGQFTRFDTVTVDDELPPDGKGLGSGKRVALRYENGQNCWNGPNRSTLVVLACAETDEIWKITEEEKCVYRMEVGTPAVCGSATNGRSSSEAPKDEL